jgi:hypothetical protein
MRKERSFFAMTSSENFPATKRHKHRHKRETLRRAQKGKHRCAKYLRHIGQQASGEGGIRTRVPRHFGVRFYVCSLSTLIGQHLATSPTPFAQSLPDKQRVFFDQGVSFSIQASTGTDDCDLYSKELNYPFLPRPPFRPRDWLCRTPILEKEDIQPIDDVPWSPTRP